MLKFVRGCSSKIHCTRFVIKGQIQVPTSKPQIQLTFIAYCNLLNTKHHSRHHLRHMLYIDLTVAGLAQSVECLTAEREVADWIPGAGPLLRVLK